MVRSSVKTDPTQIVLGDGSVFACPCGSREFRPAGDPTHWFCRCGKVYTASDFSITTTEG